MIINKTTKFDVGDKAWAIVDGEMAEEKCECCGGFLKDSISVVQVDVNAVFVVSRKKDKINITYQIYKKVYSILDERDLFKTKEKAEKELEKRNKENENRNKI